MDKIIEEKYLNLNEKRLKFKALFDINGKIMSIIENNKDLKHDYSSLIGSKKERNEYKDVPILCFDKKPSCLDGLVVNDFLTQLNDFYKRLELWYDSKTPILVKIYENYRKQLEGMNELKTHCSQFFNYKISLN
jgi:hypothetical protein